jgi:NTP pyrophosphatase (non-canonical NTP hydrolase)
MLKFNDYQKSAMETAIYGAGHKVNYPILGLVGEAGELANKYKKTLRDENGTLTPEKNEALRDELGDVLWYCAALARDLGCTLEEVAIMNLDKLRQRKEKGTIHGSGDNR